MSTPKRTTSPACAQPEVSIASSHLPSDHVLYVGVNSPSIRDDGSGGIVEAPELLEILDSMRDRMAVVLNGKAEMGPIIAIPGCYAYSIRMASDQKDLLCHSVATLLVPLMQHADSQVRANASSPDPQTLSGLGIPKDIARVFDAMAKFEAFGACVEIWSDAGETPVPLPCPTKDELSSIATENRERRHIDGVVTMVGSEGAVTRLQVNNSVIAFAPGLDLKHAASFLFQPTRIVAYLAVSGQDYTLEEAKYSAGTEAPRLLRDAQ